MLYPFRQFLDNSWGTSLEGGEIFDEGVDGFEVGDDLGIVDGDEVLCLYFLICDSGH